MAERYGISIIGIEQANPGVDDNHLLVGQTICLPLPPCQNGFQYIIKPNDTLHHISQMYNVTVESILNRNRELNPYNLHIGQAICIPPSIDVDCPMERFHIVRPGETLHELANRFHISLQSLLFANNHIESPNRVPVGTKLCVPSSMETIARKEFEK
ncbi:LysM peptidoglycan-binding domain-containing protein [Halalkalibacter kiskunsagensis]|uniref:LysM peptidoglycan-binding domain-containing protein n=1 Tax=Halalkalibacter kiskunsagensis TaxID=1548599 RepID=UPI003AB6BBC2